MKTNLKSFKSLVETLRVVPFSSLFENENVESVVSNIVFGEAEDNKKSGLVDADYIDSVLERIEQDDTIFLADDEDYAYIEDFRENIIPYMMDENIFTHLGA